MTETVEQIDKGIDGPIVRIRGLSKSYGGIQALLNVSMNITRGEIHALCGENGAGKSTLIKLLTGIILPDEGDILVSDRPLTAGSVAASETAGIAVMHQESTAFPDLNAVDNLFVGRELTKYSGLFLDRRAMRQQSKQLFEKLGTPLNPDAPVGSLPLAQRQMVALARALSRDCRMLIMDEPTASLSHRETQSLLTIIQQLRDDGVSVLYVSHRLDEIFQIADRVTVLRDGRRVATHAVSEIDAAGLIREMVGRVLDDRPKRSSRASAPKRSVLQVDGLTARGRFRDITFNVHAGEIVGLSGLVGAGRSEIARAIFGIDAYDAGTVRVNGSELHGGSVQHAIKAGLALVPEDRQHEGLVLPLSVAANLSLAMLGQLTTNGLISHQRELAVAMEQVTRLNIKADRVTAAAATLSGGNQQKVVLGKWLALQPQVLILDEPTRGVDVGAKEQVHQLIRDLASDGLGTLVISSDLPELLSLCDRLLVMREGQIAGELSAEEANQQTVLEMSLPDVHAASVNSETKAPSPESASTSASRVEGDR